MIIDPDKPVRFDYNRKSLKSTEWKQKMLNEQL